MDEIEIAKNERNSRMEKAKSLAADSGISMLQGFFYTVGMLLATIMVESVRNRIDRKP